MMKKTVTLLLVICLVLAMAGCSSANTAPSAAASTAPAVSSPAATASAETSASSPATASASSNGLTIAAAASLKDVTAEIKTAYQAVSKGTDLSFTYGASGALQTQIEQGAPVDLFISAAAKQMDALAKGGLLQDGSRSNLLENKLVLIVPKDSKLGLKSFDDLAKDTVAKVALGEPKSVPAGQYAEQVFTSLKILDKVKAKANYGTDVRQVLTWVESGEVDAGVVYATDAMTSKKVTVVCEAPSGSIDKILYPVAIIKSSKNASEAQKFLDYLKGSDAAKIFEKYGFTIAK